jgi:peptide/nickel transport system substrate-binding protein
VEAVEAPDAYTIVFRLKWPSASFLTALASPFSWIFKADILARDIRWYEKNIMGTGPFLFVEHQRGSHWVRAAPARRGGALPLHAPVAPHRAA